MKRVLVASRLPFLQILYLSLKKWKSKRIITRAGLLAIIHQHCKMGNLTQTKMDVHLCSPLACLNMRLIMVFLQTSNLFLGKCLTTLQTVPWIGYIENYCHAEHFLKGKLAEEFEDQCLQPPHHWCDQQEICWCSRSHYWSCHIPFSYQL